MVVLDVLKDFGSLCKLEYFVMDNAGSSDRLIRTVSAALLEKGVIYDVDQHRLRCNGQVINLAVRALQLGRLLMIMTFLNIVQPMRSLLNG